MDFKIKFEKTIERFALEEKTRDEQIKSMTLKQIAEYIVPKYPNSCLAKNLEMNPVDLEIDDILLDQLMDFFAYDALDLCGCGRPEDTWMAIREVLSIQNDFHLGVIDDYDGVKTRYRNILKIDLTNDHHHGYYQFVLYSLNHAKLMEHGSSVGGGWLTDLGKMYLNVLNRWYETENENKKKEM